MGFGSSGGSDLLGSDKPKPLGLREDRLPSHEFGRSVPYFAGYGMMSGIFISEAWGVRSEPVKKKVGKKKQVIGYNYYCSFAMLFCLGPVDRIEELWMEEELHWQGSVSRGATDYADITVPGFGTMRLYWGTETQVEDPDLAASGVVHPAYRGQCYAVFKNWFLGMNRTQVQGIELKLQRTPAVPWISASQNLTEDANPVAVFGEVWSSPRFGLGLTADRLDTAALNAAAVRLATEDIGVSPFMARAQKFTRFMADLFDYIDGYAKHGADGKFSFGLVRPFTGTPVSITEDQIVSPPVITSNLWWDTINEVQVKFSNRDRYFETETVAHRDRASYAIVGATITKGVTREWITRQPVAQKLAAGLGRQWALPNIEATVKVRKDAVQTLGVGDVIELSYAASNLSLVRLRVLAITIDSPESPTATLKVIEDRGYLNAEFYLPTPDTPQTEQVYTAEALYDQAVIELPYGWTREADQHFGFAPTRNDVVSNSFVAWWERLPGTYVDVGTSEVFWMSGVLNAGFSEDEELESANPLDVTFGGTDKTLDPITYAEATSSPYVFLFIGDEIFLPYDLTLVSPARYSMKVLRARYGTVPATHAPGAVVRVFIKYTSDILTQEFTPPTGDAQNWKLQPHFMSAGLPLADCPVVSLTPRFVALAPIPPANLTVNGDGVNPTYGTGDDIVVDWDETNELRDQRAPEEILHSRAEYTLLEVLNLIDFSYGTIRVPGALGPYTITNAALLAKLPAETDFKLRARYEFAGVASLTFAEITVWKV